MSYHPDNRTFLIASNRFYSAYSRKLVVDLVFDEDSPHTRQEFADECDINNIMAQYQTNGGQLFHINEALPQYLDVSGEDFRDHMDFVAEAKTMFQELPSKIRARFENDPAQFLDFCSQDKNGPELASMGLLSDEAVERMETQRVEQEKALTAFRSAPKDPPPQDLKPA